QLAVGNAAATMLSGLVALTMMPLWAKLSQLAGEVVVEQKRISVRLVDAAARYWAPDYSQHKRLFRTFSSRAIVVSGLALIATIIEARQIWGDISASRSETEKLLHMSKLCAVVLMGVPTIAQLGSATIGLFGGAAAGAIFAPWIVIGLAVT